MPVRVLIVDDSIFIRRQITKILTTQKDIEIIGEAVNGLEAIAKASELAPDVITMDIQMPELDGISAVKQIMRDNPTPILMLSVATQSGAQATIDALEAGAVDFLPKQLNELSSDRQEAKRLLRTRVRLLAQSKIKPTALEVKPPSVLSQNKLRQHPAKQIRHVAKNKFDLLLIAASTGGPVVIKNILEKIPSDFSMPVLLVQHMPASFTPSFAERLDRHSKIEVREARDGDILQTGVALLAPGGLQMELKAKASRCEIILRKGHSGEHYHPCVDTTFTSIAENFLGNILAIVLTGMGSDGKRGIEKLKQGNATVWAQNEESCVVYGMPRAVIEARMADRIASVDEIVATLGQI